MDTIPFLDDALGLYTNGSSNINSWMHPEGPSKINGHKRIVAMIFVQSEFQWQKM